MGDGNFTNANQFFENVLNLNPHNSEAYFGKLMCEMRVTKQEQIITSSKYLNEYSNFEKAVRFADQRLKATLLKYEQTVSDTINEQKYNSLLKMLPEVKESDDLSSIKNGFKEIESFKKANHYITLLNDIENEKKNLATLKRKKNFDFYFGGPFVIIGGIVAVICAICGIVETIGHEGVVTGILAGLVGGIVFVLVGLLGGFILDITLFNLIRWIIYKKKTPADISARIKDSKKEIDLLYKKLKNNEIGL